MTVSFKQLGLRPELLDQLDSLNYEQPTPIQEQAIPELLNGRDVMGQAQTGTGKTAAFALPILNRLEGDDLQVLILTPTRELAIQVSEAVYRYGSNLGVRVLPVYGGQSYDRQIRRLKKGVHVVVGTPGRTLDLIRQRVLRLENVRFVVLDEADEMLKMGFIEDIETILSATNKDTRQTILFSATFSSDIRKLARQYMRDPLQIEVESAEMTADNIEQRYYLVREEDKVAALSRLLEVESIQNALIFTRTKVGSAELAQNLMGRGYPSMAIHGDLSQAERERILRSFRNGELKILVATDVMARGVDIPEVSHVINFDIPQLAIEYVHRIGRTGRAGRAGSALTLISSRQSRQLKMIMHHTGTKIELAKLPELNAVLESRNEGIMSRVVDLIVNLDNPNDALTHQLLSMYAPDEIITSLIKLYRNETQAPLEEIRNVKESADSGKYSRDSRDSNRRRGSGSGSGNSRRERSSGSAAGPAREKGMVRLHMNAGRVNGIRPGDVVFGVASAANIPGKAIGAIEIQQRDTYVDVPEQHVQAVLKGARRSRIRGHEVKLELA